MIHGAGTHTIGYFLREKQPAMLDEYVLQNGAAPRSAEIRTLATRMGTRIDTEFHAYWEVNRRWANRLLIFHLRSSDREESTR